MCYTQDWGAVGNGVTDDTNAFISCIAAISSNPGAIFVPPGMYPHVNQPAMLLHMHGAHCSVVPACQCNVRAASQPATSCHGSYVKWHKVLSDCIGCCSSCLHMPTLCVKHVAPRLVPDISCSCLADLQPPYWILPHREVRPDAAHLLQLHVPGAAWCWHQVHDTVLPLLAVTAVWQHAQG